MAVDLARARRRPARRRRASRSIQRIALPDGLVPLLQRTGWMLVSVGCFAGLWELLWAFGLADAKLLPPPHIFLGNLAEQARFFNTAQRWQIGTGDECRPEPRRWRC